VRPHNGVYIRQTGFGVFRLPDDATTERAVLTAIECPGV
jgi:diketogulonate reductase-like aldo/keto reductase